MKDWEIGADDDDSGSDVNPQDPAYEDMMPPDTWGNPDLGNFENHYEDHGDDFNATSPEDYADQANQFYDRIADEGLPAVEGPDGTIRAYDPDTNAFGVYNSDGTTATFFQPDNGADYFQQQIDKDLNNGGSMINPYSSGAGPENYPISGTTVPEPPYTGEGGGGSGGILPGVVGPGEEFED